MIKQTLKRIVFGLIFILINFNIQLGGGSLLNLLPNFVGYIIIFRAISMFLKESDSSSFALARKFSFMLTFLYLAFFIMDLLGITAMLNTDYALVSITMAVVALVFQLMFLYHLTLGILEVTDDEALKKRLRFVFRVVAVGNVFIYILIDIPSLAAIILLITLVANVYYILIIHQIKKSIPDLYVLKPND